jgi:hypothetical protein
MQGLGGVTADVDAHLGHDLDRLGPDGCRLRPRAEDLISIAGEMPEHAVGHLRPGAVVGADEQNPLLAHASSLIRDR